MSFGKSKLLKSIVLAWGSALASSHFYIAGNEKAVAEVKKPKIDETWYEALKDEFEADYFKELKSFLQSEKSAGKTIYPPGPEIFNAFNFTPLDKVRVVILGQDPYHGPQQAHGLCFSVRKGIKPPPSLINIFKELNADLGLAIPGHGDLSQWAKSGVLLLNAILTVRMREAASHQNRGWEAFTDSAIRAVSDHSENCVFMLWGRFAQGKKPLIDESKHLILTAAHPSPFSAHNGFFGCKHFSSANAYLNTHGKASVDWSIS